MEQVAVSPLDQSGSSEDFAIQCNDCKKVVEQVWQWKGWRVLCWPCLKKAELWEEMD
jgi:hypothetical protein